VAFVAIIDDAGVVENTVCKIPAADAMAYAAVGSCWGMVDRCRLATGANAVAVGMAVFTGLYAGINHSVIEYAVETKDAGAVANATIDGHFRVADGLAGCGCTIVAACAIFRDGAVVDKGVFEVAGVMAGTTFRIGDKVAFVFTNSGDAVMTGITAACNTGVIKVAIDI